MGADLADLDNDGDLDLIVNNVNMPVFVFENKSKNSNNYIKFEMKGLDKNVNAIGTKIIVKTKKRYTNPGSPTCKRLPINR